MASSFITRLLRASVTHRPATTTLLHPHHNFHRPLHTFTPTSPLSFLRSHPSNLPILNLHYFSTSRRGRPRATKSKLRSLLGSTASLLLDGAVITCVDICLIWGLVKFVTSLYNDGMGTKFKGSLPDLFHKGRSVVVEGKLTINEGYCFEYCFSATEVLTTPDELASAMERNKYILAEKLNVANQKQNVAFAGEELEVAVNRCTIPSDKILNDVVHPSKVKICLDGLVLEGRVNQSRAFSLIAQVLFAVLIKDVLAYFEGLPDALREGHSVVVERSVKMIRHENWEEDESGKSLAVKVCGSERHFSAEVLAKHDHDKYMPQNAVVAAAIEE